jgi:ATP-dependent Lon protease
MFVTTANMLAPRFNRLSATSMDIIPTQGGLHGDEEKVEIAKRHLIPKPDRAARD